MKKAEPQKTTYNTLGSAGNHSSPMPPSAGSSATGGRRWADPSSAERSNRYPIPEQEHRPG